MPDHVAPDPVRPSALGDGLEPRQLFGGGGHDHLAAGLEGDAVLAAKGLQHGLAPPTVQGLERAWLVVDARVDDAGVVPGLVPSNSVLLLEEQHPGARAARGDLERGGETDDAPTDDRDIRSPVHAGPGPP